MNAAKVKLTLMLVVCMMLYAVIPAYAKEPVEAEEIIITGEDTVSEEIIVTEETTVAEETTVVEEITEQEEILIEEAQDIEDECAETETDLLGEGDSAEPSTPSTPFYIEAEDGCSFIKLGEMKIAQELSPPDICLQYSYDGEQWADYIDGQTYKVSDGKVATGSNSKVYFRVPEGKQNKHLAKGFNARWGFTSDGSFKVGGNIMSLLNYDYITNHEFESEDGENAFVGLFAESGVTDASDLLLPATKLTNSCYGSMFAECNNLTAAPELPAYELAKFCYSSMFRGCKNLTEAPELPAIKLATACYFGMFSNCKNLTAAPDIPATTLVDSCYKLMFRGCARLESIKVGFTKWQGNGSTDAWLSGVSASGTFYCYEGLNRDFRGESGIPEGWRIVVSESPAEERRASGRSSAGTNKTVPVVSSQNWYTDLNGVWKIRNSKGEVVKNTWLCDDAAASNGGNVWYMLGPDGSMITAGLVMDNTGNFYSLETNHDGSFGMMRYKDGYYNCNGFNVYLKFSQKHDGTFGSIINPEGIIMLKGIYGITGVGIGNENFVHTATF